MINLDTFRYSLPIQIRWNDLDALGHVNNAVYITYFEAARGHYMLEACPGWSWNKDMFLIANVNVDYLKELFLASEDVRVHMKTTKLGNKSFELEYVLSSKKGDERIIHATGKTTQVMFDLKERRSTTITDEVRRALSHYDQL